MLRNFSSVASGSTRPASSTALNCPEKILIVRLGALGDIVHALPAQQQIHRRFPDCEIHWLVEPHYRGLLETVPGIHRIWTADTKRWRRRPGTALDLVRLVPALRRERFDLALDFQGLIKSAFLARLSGAGRRMGFCRERCREPAAAGFYTDTVPTSGDGHVIDLNLELAGSLGCAGEATARVPFRLPAEARHYVDSRLQAAGGGRPVLLNPGRRVAHQALARPQVRPPGSRDPAAPESSGGHHLRSGRGGPGPGDPGLLPSRVRGPVSPPRSWNWRRSAGAPA